MNEKDNTHNDTTSHKLIEWFRQATPYINTHRGKTFVIMISGDAVADSNIHNIIHDIVLLNSLGIKIVIVHGVRNQLDKKLASEGIKSEFVQGLRVSNNAILEATIQACSLVRSRLETKLSMGLPNSPMHGAKVRVASANVITAKPAGIIDGVDLQQTGLVRKIDTETINTFLNMNNVVLLSPIGHSPAGDAFSLSYQHVAAEIAEAVQAEKLIAFTDKQGLYTKNGDLLRELSPSKADNILPPSNNNSELQRSAEATIKAVRNGVPRAHIMSYKIDGALLQELFSVDGTGTLIQQNHFEKIRPANSDDIPAIIDIIRPLEKKGVLLKRNREKIEKEISHFTVIEREGFIIALAALYPFEKEHIGEIACITTHPEYRNSSRGTLLLQAMEKQARDKLLSKVFVLTTQTAHWFIEQGFSEGTLESLPCEKQALYNFQRSAKVFIKSIE